MAEASLPGPGSKRRRSLRLRALQRSMDGDSGSSFDEQPLVRSASVPSDVLSALEQDLFGSRSPPTAAPRNPETPGRARDVSEGVATVLDSPLQKPQGRRSQRSIPSTQDASWEDPGPTVKFDLTQLESSDEDQCNFAETGRNVMPRWRQNDNLSTVLLP